MIAYRSATCRLCERCASSGRKQNIDGSLDTDTERQFGARYIKYKLAVVANLLSTINKMKSTRIKGWF